MVKANKGDFIEIEYSGYANGELFDSNIEEEVKKLHAEAKGEKTVVVIGEKMTVEGLDDALDGKEVGKDYEVKFDCKKGFGDRKREIIKTVPLSAYTQHKINPQPGMTFNIDNQLVKVIAVSGARVITDFNNPLAGKDLEYKFKILKVVKDDKEKAEALFKGLFRMLPEFRIEGDKVIVKGVKQMEIFVKAFEKKFKDLMGKDLVLEEIKPGKEKKVDESKKMTEGEMLDKLEGKKKSDGKEE